MMLPLLAQATDAAVMTVPRDIPLPLPAAESLIKFVLVAAFLAHILFVNLMVGGVTLTLVFEWLGLRRKAYDSLARAIAATVTVNKSMAVVLGVAPLLAINVLYTVWFYTANAITGRAWISVIPLVAIAFLLVYLHKYTWDRLADRKPLHMAILVPAAVILWFIPLIFLANINLMLLPQHWDVPGFFAAVLLDNVLPRYAHFVLASLALVSLFGVWWFGRRDRREDEHPVRFAPAELKRKFYFIAMVTTAGQMAIGPLVYFTLPPQGVTTAMTIVVFTGAAFGITALLTMASEIGAADDRIGRKFGGVVALLTVTVILMATGRHLYRDGALAEHRELVAEKTAQWTEQSRFARARYEANAALLASGPVGQTVFKTTCRSCHAVDHVLVGPSLREIASLYRDKPAGIAAWTANPGKKRAGMPQMPAFALGAEVLKQVGQYMIELGSAQP